MKKTRLKPLDIKDYIELGKILDVHTTSDLIDNEMKYQYDIQIKLIEKINSIVKFLKEMMKNETKS